MEHFHELSSATFKWECREDKVESPLGEQLNNDNSWILKYFYSLPNNSIFWNILKK